MGSGDLGWSVFAILMVFSGVCFFYHILELVNDFVGHKVTPVQEVTSSPSAHEDTGERTQEVTSSPSPSTQEVTGEETSSDSTPTYQYYYYEGGGVNNLREVVVSQ